MQNRSPKADMRPCIQMAITKTGKVRLTATLDDWKKHLTIHQKSLIDNQLKNNLKNKSSIILDQEINRIQPNQSEINGVFR